MTETQANKILRTKYPEATIYRRKRNNQKSSWNIAKYNTTKYHLMGKGDLFLPYFLYKFSKNTCIFHFYVLQYNYIKERR